MMTERYHMQDLLTLAQAMLTAAGQSEDHAKDVAATLVEADLLGYTTHGIQFLPQYCDALEKGAMTSDGEMTLVSDKGGCLVYDGNLISGPRCMQRAVAEALRRSGEQGVVTALIRRAHNTACLATYLLPVIEAGRIGLIFVSGPGSKAVAPPGGREGRFSTNPFAAGFPTGDDPVLIDMASSATTNRMTERLARQGLQHTGEPMLDADGNLSNDPNVLVGGGGGSIRPFGGEANEHKGYAIALMIEALSACLSGGGRAMIKKTGQVAGSSAFIQIINPEFFAGEGPFLSEMQALTTWLQETPPRPGSSGVRVPGQRAFAARRDRLENGVELHDSIRPHVEPVAERYGLKFPAALAN
jgi:LDH2 family malate/lactate/ureidoglycolate dehydrogenase